MAPRTYGSTESGNEEEVELLPTNDEAHIGTIDFPCIECISDVPDVAPKKSLWTRHHCIAYTLAAGICLFSAHYWHNRATLYNDDENNNAPSDVSVVHKRGGRVPMPPALSTVDPASLGFRTTTRSGLALPSKAWGEKYLNGEEFTALPTNEWYGNLLSHRAAADPEAVGEMGHVYTIPYILGVSPPKAPKCPKAKDATTAKKQTMAGIELFVPVMKASTKNMQMVFNSNNGITLGAIVNEKSAGANKDKKKDGDSESALTSYIVDPNEPISPLGVSLKWNHVNMRSHIVRGMPYGTVRFGKDRMQKSVLPTITAGNRVASILLDSDKQGKDAPKMMCGSFTGEHIDQNPNHSAPISKDGKAHAYSVKREMVFHMNQSDFSWVVFFSRPVKVECFSSVMPAVSVPGPIEEVQFRLNVVEVSDGVDPDEELVVRMALLDECTTGHGVIKEHCDHLKKLGYDTVSSKEKSKEYLKVLREGAMLYPKSPLVGTQFPEEGDEDDNEGRVTNVVFDWDATPIDSKSAPIVPKKATASIVAGSFGLRATSSEITNIDTIPSPAKSKKENDAFVMFALPHHIEALASNSDYKANDSLCLHTFHGRTCLVQGSVWDLPVKHGKPQSFLADRPPVADAIPLIAEALTEDIKFKVTSNVLRGAADTYFPAKILAKMGRIIEINEELQNLKSNDSESFDYSDADEATIEEAVSAAADVTLPTDEEVESLLDELQQSVEIWLNPGGKEKDGAEAEFLYDESWGGFINCGCEYTFKKGHEGEGSCNNTFPECPAIEDVNQDFGNGWYNDHHFHYGYHVYAAAIVAKHRPEWGREYYERILFYIRDIANPSSDDKAFPVFRQKDWYLGNSWAAGLMSMELSPHGREQESSSEAIAAFEGVSLFGNVMTEVFADDEEKLESARLVRNVGELLTAMEVSATNRFWHVWGSKNDEEESTTVTSSASNNIHVNTYPAQYNKPVVGMMHETMASFQTWFAPEDVVSYGIQFIPLTAVAERRDDPEWSNILYPVYAESCETANDVNDGFCEDNGWSIVQAGLLAETGEISDALEMAADIPEEVFISLGGDGESLSNTYWFIATRPPNTAAQTQ